jgi:hypothetical protein
LLVGEPEISMVNRSSALKFINSRTKALGGFVNVSHVCKPFSPVNNPLKVIGVGPVWREASPVNGVNPAAVMSMPATLPVVTFTTKVPVTDIADGEVNVASIKKRSRTLRRRGRHDPSCTTGGDIKSGAASCCQQFHKLRPIIGGASVHFAGVR